MSHAPFVHCNVHTEFSLFASTMPIKDVVAQAVAFRMPALAITDDGVMDGVISFNQQCIDASIKPLFGCKIYLAPSDNTESQGFRPTRLTLLAKDQSGYQALCKLVSASHRDKRPDQLPLINPALLEAHRQGLIVLSGGIQGEIAQKLLLGQEAEARSLASWYKERFDFYLEIQNHGLDQEKKLNRQLIQLAKSLEIPLLASNHVRYLHRSDEHLFQTWRRLGQVKYEALADDFNYPGGSEYYFKSSEEMSRLFQGVPEALSNSLEIADKCRLIDIKPDLGQRMPSDVKPGETSVRRLRELAWKGLEEKFEEITPEIRYRLETELEIMEEKEQAAHYVLTADLLAWVKQSGIVLGPGEGAIPGSLVSYVLGICTIDPIRFQLHVEAFFNRYQFRPNIQLQIPAMAQRDMLNYLGQKYGMDKVALCTKHRHLHLRELLGDLAKLRGFSEVDTQQLISLVPDETGVTVAEALEMSSALRTEMNRHDKVQNLVYDAQSLERLPTERTTHFSGLVISPEPLDRLLPLRFEQGQPIVQFTSREVRHLNFFQLNLLPIDELKVLTDVQKRLLESRDIDLDLATIPLDDPAAFALIHTGDTEGIFLLDQQPEKRQWAIKLKPDTLEELADMITLDFLGPQEQGLDAIYLKRKQGEEIPSLGKNLDALVEPILGRTKGLILYKDQLLFLAERVAGFTPDEAIDLRNMSRTSSEHFASQLKALFLAGARQREIPIESAELLFEQMQKQGANSINKGHMLGLAWIIYCCAWVKAHYPAEWALCLQSNMSGKPKRL